MRRRLGRRLRKLANRLDPPSQHWTATRTSYTTTSGDYTYTVK